MKNFRLLVVSLTLAALGGCTAAAPNGDVTSAAKGGIPQASFTAVLGTGSESNQKITRWNLKKDSLTPTLVDPNGAPAKYEVTVTEGQTVHYVTEVQTLSITNSGTAPAYIATFVANLQKKSGKQFATFASAVADRAVPPRTTVPTCFGDFTNNPAVVSFVIVDADNNDVVALSAVPQIQVGETKTFVITVVWDADALGLVAGMDIRTEYLTTFENAGPRGNSGNQVSCLIDADGDGTASDSRTVAARVSAPIPAVEILNGSVTLTDQIKASADAAIATVTDFVMGLFTLLEDGSNVLSWSLPASGTSGTMTVIDAVGSATCNAANLDGGNTKVTNGAALDGDAPAYITGSPALADIAITCTPKPPPSIDPGDFRTYTQGGWGADCHKGNPGCVRDGGFATVFPSGLRIGDSVSDGAPHGFSAIWTTSAAVDLYLPAGHTPSVLTADLANAKSTSSGVFGGQLVAATLNVKFDAAGLLPKNNTAVKLGDLYYHNPTDNSDPLNGFTVTQILGFANTAISGQPSPYSASQLNDALTHINENFDGGNVNQGWLSLTP